MAVLYMLAGVSATAAGANCTLPIPLSGVMCSGLTHYGAATDAASCGTACCGDAACQVWMFGSTGCWLGECDTPITKGGFEGGARAMPSPFCGNASSVAHPIVGVQCLGLTQAPGNPPTADACERVCCANASCKTWVFDQGDAKQGGCWIGSVVCKGGPNPAWNGSSSLSHGVPPPPPPPSPPPPLPSGALPRLTPRPGRVGGVGGVGDPWLDLNGKWDFFADASNASVAAAPIQVPGEYTLQGFRVPWGTTVRYSRTFDLPAGWHAPGSLRVKLKADGVYSNASVAVNGVAVGGHLGGFTPFELDVTDAVKARTGNRIDVNVTATSLADTLASGIRYASHDLGGITRKIYLVMVPCVSVADVWAATAELAPPSVGGTADATVNVSVTVANDGVSASAPTTAAVTICEHEPTPATTAANVDAWFAAGGARPTVRNCTGKQAAGKFTLTVPSIEGGGGRRTVVTQVRIASARLWTPEQPNLYTFEVVLGDGAAMEQTAISVGVRTVEARGSMVYLNGVAIKARGTTRHETHPLNGRSLWGVAPAGGQWARDVVAFRDININWFRTSHYPPAEELMQAADELGMMVEVEAPFCWASGNVGSAALNYTVQAHTETLVFNRHHASVVAYSLGNESPWNLNFNLSYWHFVIKVDNTRPFMFDGGSGQKAKADGGPLDIITVHYPGFNFPYDSNQTHPTTFGEYAHLNCYNRRELLADPGLRDNWAVGVQEVWERVWASDVVTGACYWAGIDDIFYMPPLNGTRHVVGYGPWGVIDSWRRAKPETHAVQNIYSTVVLRGDAPSAVALDNRHDFTDLADVNFTWRVADGGAGALTGRGTVPGGCAPHTTGCRLELTGLPPGTDYVEINATSPRGFLINRWLVGQEHTPVPPGSATQVSVQRHPDGSGTVTVGDQPWVVSAAGSVSTAWPGQKPLVVGGPTAMVLAVDGSTSQQMTEANDRAFGPWTDPLDGWAAKGPPSFRVASDRSSAVVNISGSYNGTADAEFGLVFDGSGVLAVDFAFTWKGARRSVRQLGVVFDLDQSVSRLSWDRRGQFSAYPADAIGRPHAVNVDPDPCADMHGACPHGASTPTNAWKDDTTPLGSNDFRSTKANATLFQLCGAASGCFAMVSEDGTRHGRAWLNQNAPVVSVLAATVSSEGGNPFSRERVLPWLTLTSGDVAKGSVSFTTRRLAP